MDPHIKKRVKRVMSIFQNKPDQARHDQEAGDNYDAESHNQRADTERQNSPPIYFDEFSLSKFIEDYLEY